ncbi:MAG TPA: hypothetical protein VFI42_03965 [Thermomicrobiaceae bacterium]|nr:hypothetical protein [Thermomicrobiaceae bacterium]
MKTRGTLVGAIVGLLLLALASAPVTAMTPVFANPAFQATWARTDLPVAVGQVDRTWMWGSLPYTPALHEAYADAPGGVRTVQYFDKTRMEDNSYRDSAPWDVTNGLLAEELISGRMQFGDNAFRQFPPAVVNVAGDADDPNGPTYASFNHLMGYQPIPSGWAITQTVDRAGQVGADPALGAYGVTAAYNVNVPGINHTVASVFWDFMNSSGPISIDDQLVNGRLFPDPFYATGYPLTEAYWTHVLVAGTPRLVLVQVFERRVLTYTPDNPEGWQVEAGNVGQHYYAWRYGQLGNPGP